MQQGEGVFRLDDDLFAQLAQAHSTCKLLHGNSIIQKRRRKVEIGVVGSVADDQVIGVDIDTEIFYQVSFGPLRGRVLDEDKAERKNCIVTTCGKCNDTGRAGGSYLWR